MRVVLDQKQTFIEKKKFNEKKNFTHEETLKIFL